MRKLLVPAGIALIALSGCNNSESAPEESVTETEAGDAMVEDTGADAAAMSTDAAMDAASDAAAATAADEPMSGPSGGAAGTDD